MFRVHGFLVVISTVLGRYQYLVYCTKLGAPAGTL